MSINKTPDNCIVAPEFFNKKALSSFHFLTHTLWMKNGLMNNSLP